METACVSMTVWLHVFHQCADANYVILARRPANIRMAGKYRKVLIGQNHLHNSQECISLASVKYLTGDNIFLNWGQGGPLL